MEKFKLTNRIEQPGSQEKSLLYLRHALSEYKWLFLIGWTMLVGLAFFFVGWYAHKYSNREPEINPLLAFNSMREEAKAEEASSDNTENTSSGDEV